MSAASEQDRIFYSHPDAEVQSAYHSPPQSPKPPLYQSPQPGMGRWTGLGDDEDEGRGSPARKNSLTERSYSEGDLHATPTDQTCRRRCDYFPNVDDILVVDGAYPHVSCLAYQIEEGGLPDGTSSAKSSPLLAALPHPSGLQSSSVPSLPSSPVPSSTVQSPPSI